jgi:hypothetical protein
MGFPNEDKEVKIFDKLPTANEEAFDAGVPLDSTAHAMTRIILYAPGLRSIGAIDNSGSDASATWSRSVSTGFRFGTTYTISAEVAVEINGVFAKGTFKVSSSLSLTAEWSKLVTETISFQVPGGKKAFAYQGYLRSALLQYSNSKYAYKDDNGVGLTPIVVTTKELKK